MIWIAIAAFTATVPLANWLIGHIGTECIPNGPCLIPVGFGLDAPSGVLVVGIALVLRDVVHRMAGPGYALLAIAIGSVASLYVAPATLAVASALAFTLSELADFAVYAPLARRRLALAVLLSGLAGSVVDSAAFLWFAFGSLDHLAGQVVGKLYASGAAFTWIVVTRRLTAVQRATP